MIGKVAQHAVGAPDGGELVQAGEVITPRMTDAAEYLEVLVNKHLGRITRLSLYLNPDAVARKATGTGGG